MPRGYRLTTDPEEIDPIRVQGFLAGTYWAKGIPLDSVRRAMANSLCFGILHRDGLVGFCRVITDLATFGYLADVFVEPSHRGKGLAKWLMSEVFADPRLQGFRRWVLVTRDAHGLYRGNGFGALAHPEMYMERWDPDVYERRGPA